MTRLLFIKLLRDLETTWVRIVLMVVAISISLVAFSAMLYTLSIVESNISSGYRSANPASARITLNPEITLDQVEAILNSAKAEPGIIDAAMRSVSTLPMQTKDGELSTTPLLLFIAAPDDPMQIASFRIEAGSWPPPPGGILMERSALEFLELKVGDSIVALGFDEKPVRLNITGAVNDPSLAPAYTGQQAYAFISTASLPLLGKQPTLNQLIVTVADQAGQTEPGHDRDAIVRNALSLASQMERTYSAEIVQVAVPPPYQHPHQGIANSLLLALLAFGALSLVLSAILIATLFDGLLTQQIPQVGILKAIGASSSRILQVYSIMILLVSIAATALAFIPGIMLGRVLAPRVLTGALNMDATDLSIPWWIYTIVVSTGIVLPLLMALAPLVRASRRTVRQALDERGVDRQGVATTRLYAWLGKLGGLDSTLLMAFRNIFRRRARFLLSVGLLATAGTIFVSGLNTFDGLRAIPQTLTDEHRWDVEVKTSRPVSASELAGIIAQIPNVTHVETWATVSTGVQYPGEINVTRTYPDQGHGSLGLTAIPLDSSVFVPPPVLDGRWLRPDDTDAIVLPQTILKTLPDMQVGKTIQLPVEGQLTSWQVVGIVKELAGATCPCVSRTSFEQAIGNSGQANLIRIVTNDHDLKSRTTTGQATKQALTDASIKVQYVRPFDSLIASTEGHSILLIVLILLAALVIGVVGLIGLGSMMSTNVIERIREFGMMSAIGASAATVRGLVIAEGIFIALASCVAAALPTLILTLLMGAGLGDLFFSAPIPLRVSATAIVIWVIVVVLGAVLATWMPASRASRLTVREALAYL